MSFTVAERTREIGLRTALGAQAASIVSAIARRAFAQLAVGVVLGIVLSASIMPMIVAEEAFFYTTRWELTVGLIGLSVFVVGMLACASPTRGGLRIQPVEALKAE